MAKKKKKYLGQKRSRKVGDKTIHEKVVVVNGKWKWRRCDAQGNLLRHISKKDADKKTDGKKKSKSTKKKTTSKKTAEKTTKKKTTKRKSSRSVFSGGKICLTIKQLMEFVKFMR